VSDIGEPQDIAEALDADKVDDADGYSDLPLGDFPPDAPLGSLDYGVTDREQAVDEPLADRVAREEPDPLAEEIDPMDPHLASSSVRLSEDAASAARREGRLVGEGLIGAPDLSAEEAAVHLEPEPEG
jgi:hypothetical protein